MIGFAGIRNERAGRQAQDKAMDDGAVQLCVSSWAAEVVHRIVS
jgi:hypothetical protein